MNVQKIIITLVHAFIGWMLCAATMGIGMAVTSLNNALIIHAIAAPIFFAGITWAYFRKFNFTTPIPDSFDIRCFCDRNGFLRGCYADQP